jgi:AcrR family transcriptional regulator
MRTQLLDAAERVFYARGIQAVNMGEIRAASDLPLKRMYQLFPSKNDLAVAFLRRRHDRMMAALASRAGAMPSPREQVLSVFDYLDEWFQEPSFRGCPWMNAYGELGGTNPAIAAEVYHHEEEFHALVADIVVEAGYAPEIVNAVYLLIGGAVSAAATRSTPDPAGDARRGVEILLGAAHAYVPRRPVL